MNQEHIQQRVNDSTRYEGGKKLLENDASAGFSRMRRRCPGKILDKLEKDTEA